MDYSTRRLKELREEADKSQQWVADTIGISDTAYQNYEHGKRDIPSNVLEALAELYETSTDYLLGLVSYKNKRISPSSSDSLFVDVPLYGSIAAGIPLEMLPVDDAYPAPKQIVDRYPDGFWLQIASNSMDLLFPVRSLVYVDPMDDIRVNGKPYALCVNGYDATVKLVDKLSNGYKLSPASTDPTYKPQIFDYSVPGTDKVSVIGEIVYDMKPFDWSY